MTRDRAIATVLLAVALLVLAAIPWAVNGFAGPLPPSLLAATPTAYSIAWSAAKTSTRKAEILQPSRVLVSGSASAPLEIYDCPSVASKTGSYLEDTVYFDIHGWFQDPQSIIWFLVQDERNSTQKWIRSNPSVVVTPADYMPYSPKIAGCR